jgi:hypothetical protein
VGRLIGTWRSGGAAQVAADDNQFYVIDSTTSGTRTTAWLGSFGGVGNDLTSLKITYKGKQSATATQRIAIWRWTDGTWLTIGARSVGTTEVLVLNLSPPGTLADYVSGTSGDGEVRIRIRSSRTSGAFTTRGDLLRIVYAEP